MRDPHQVVPVKLLTTPWIEPLRAAQKTSRPDGPTSPPRTKLPKPPSQTKKPQVGSLSRTKIVKALRVSPKPTSPRTATIKPVAKQQSPATPPDPTPPAKPAVVKATKDNNPTNLAISAPESRQSPNDDDTKAARLARRAPRSKLIEESPKPPVSISPVRYAQTQTPRYPGKARRAGWQGTTVLRVLVDSEGYPDRVTLGRTSGFDILDVEAMRAVRHWKFHPAHKGINAIPSWVRIPVAFRLKEDGQ